MLDGANGQMGNDIGVARDAATLPALDADGAGPSVAIGTMSSYEFWLSAVLLLFGLVIIGAQLWMATRRGADGAPLVSLEAVLRLSIVSLIIVGAMVLIASGYSNNQIAPAMGLFGTIAGYVIGRQDRAGGS